MTGEELVKICSDCGAEYSPQAEVCADCGGTLISPRDYEARQVPLAQEEEKVLVREGPVRYLEELARHMNRKGIRSTVRYHGAVPGRCSPVVLFGLYVTTADEAVAKEVDREYWLRGAPENACSFQYTEQELEGQCPACSCALPKGAAECPECGLAVGMKEDVVTCPDCDAVVDDDIDKCPNCGAEFE